MLKILQPAKADAPITVTLSGIVAIVSFKQPWKGLVGNPQYWIGLAVLQVNVVAGIMFLYHVVFQDKGLVLVGCGDIFDGTCPGHENLCLNVLAARKIRGKAVLQVLGLSHVNHGACFVLPEVDAACRRSFVSCVLELLSSFSCICFHVFKIY